MHATCVKWLFQLGSRCPGTVSNGLDLLCVSSKKATIFCLSLSQAAAAKDCSEFLFKLWIKEDSVTISVHILVAKKSAFQVKHGDTWL
jgi:hypothetical protein